MTQRILLISSLMYFFMWMCKVYGAIWSCRDFTDVQAYYMSAICFISIWLLLIFDHDLEHTRGLPGFLYTSHSRPACLSPPGALFVLWLLTIAESVLGELALLSWWCQSAKGPTNTSLWHCTELFAESQPVSLCFGRTFPSEAKRAPELEGRDDPC